MRPAPARTVATVALALCAAGVIAVGMRNDWSASQVGSPGWRLVAHAALIAAGCVAVLLRRRGAASPTSFPIRNATAMVGVTAIVLIASGMLQWAGGPHVVGPALAWGLAALVLRAPRVLRIQLLVFAALLALAEGIAMAWLSIRPSPVATFHSDVSGRPLGVQDPVVGYRGQPGGGGFRTLATFGRDTLYDERLTLLPGGWRAVPGPPATATPQRFVAFFGCSFTLGEGVGDAETLPARFAAEADDPSLRVYNFGWRGWGPQSMLALLEDDFESLHLAEPSGTLVYSVIDEHVLRLVGDVPIATGWGGLLPWYERRDDGRLERRGTFAERRPLLMAPLRIVAQSHFIRAVAPTVFVGAVDADWGLFAAVLGTACAEARVRRGGSECVVVVWPGALEAARELPPRLAGMPLRVLDYSDAWTAGDTQYWIRHDRHPTPLAHATVARWLARDLKLARARLP